MNTHHLAQSTSVAIATADDEIDSQLKDQETLSLTLAHKQKTVQMNQDNDNS